MTARFRGVFLTSERPDMTARFYEQVAGLALEKVGNEGHELSPPAPLDQSREGR